MEIGRSVTKAIDEFEAGDVDSAMLHACNAVDGTANTAFPSIVGSNARFTKLIRSNYGTFGAMALPTIDLENTRFPIRLKNPKASGRLPDIGM